MRFGAREFCTVFLIVVATLAGPSPGRPYSTADQAKTNPGLDPNYIALRGMTLGKTRVAPVNGWQWKRDVGSFLFKTGHLYLFPPVLERVTGAVFVGQGEFQLEPFADIERNYLKLAYGKDSVQESFSTIVFRFTDTTLSEWEQGLKFEEGQASAEAIEAFRDQQKNTRTKLRTNVEANILEDLLDKNSPGSFAALIKAKKSERLLFVFDPRGVDTQLG